MEAAFKTIYLRYYADLVRYAMFFCTDQDEASSSVQQVFLHLWERREELLHKDHLKPYLYTSVRNRVLNEQRRKKIQLELDHGLELEQADVHELMEVDELRIKISRAIQKLPERCRYIFELSRNEEMSYKMIAEHLDLSVKTVENQMSKALRILRAEIFSSDNQ